MIWFPVFNLGSLSLVAIVAGGQAPRLAGPAGGPVNHSGDSSRHRLRHATISLTLHLVRPFFPRPRLAPRAWRWAAPCAGARERALASATRACWRSSAASSWSALLCALAQGLVHPPTQPDIHITPPPRVRRQDRVLKYSRTIVLTPGSGAGSQLVTGPAPTAPLALPCNEERVGVPAPRY